MVLKVRQENQKIILDSSMVEHSAVNRRVVGSSPTRGAFFIARSSTKGLNMIDEAPWSSG